jgi:hypothetical protein
MPAGGWACVSVIASTLAGRAERCQSAPRQGGAAAPHQRLRHVAYAGGWKRFEPLWDLVIRSKHVSRMLPLLESTLDAYGHARNRGRDARRAIDAPTTTP